MRSHITNLSTDQTEEKEKLATTRKLLPSLNNGGGGGDTGSEAATNAGYGLRENPKKTWRVADSSEDTLVSDKFCKECGKGFHSWKALFGHMKCHSDKERVSNSFEDQDSWTNNNNTNNNNASATTQKLVMDSQSDNEATAPNRRTRSKRKTRCMVSTAATSSVSFAYPSSSSLSEVEQEQEEVAMSLMMLSRDVSPWIGLHSVAESSDNYSAYFEAPSSVRTNLVIKFESNKKTTPALNGSEIAKQSDNKKWEFGKSVSANPNYKGKGSELLATEFSENRFKMNKKAIKLELDSPSALKDSGGELGKNRVNGIESVSSKSATNKYNSIKPKFFGSELKSNSLKTSEGEFSKNSHKRGKFECTTCNKVFHSYQALGGHRASHKKIKGCFASKNESSENSIETDLSPEAAATTTESKLMKNSDSEYMVEHKLAASFHNEEEIVKEFKKSKVHECPICLKVFPSGQALGGHKRSHLVGGSESRNFQTVVVQEPVPEVRDFLDLNLPAATEEESNSHADSNRPWWVVEDNHNHKQEALVGLMSS
ncbi:uncharacterized protein LOC133292264 [Gastrolobium bilobum]|uniref:uncharacterized protein LOC133292264 n=1 Tax=Gastrolobium bilobum TaxID=150636 RepID=UPI002AB134D7|nr:uncharacterized protein LOC133292264 [Gastrolobium bilobum]